MEKEGRKDIGSAIQLWAVHLMILASVSSSVDRGGQIQLYLRSLSTLKCSDVSALTETGDGKASLHRVNANVALFKGTRNQGECVGKVKAHSHRNMDL